MTANKDLSRILRYLDYPGSFDSTSFQSVASLLSWLVTHLDPSINIPGTILSDDDRQHFLDGIAGELSDKMNIIVSTSALFAAGSLAENELIKVAKVLHEAALAADDDDETSEEEPQLDAINNLAQSARSLVNEIRDVSLSVSSRLRSERNDTEQRAKACGAALEFLNCSPSSSGQGNETSHIESSIETMLQDANAAVERLDKQCKIALSNGIGMEEKIRKKTMDLERTKKRLEGLDHIRPAYMDEYEQLEEELQVEYERYVVRLRNEDYLKGELASLANETEKHHDHEEEEHTEEHRILHAGGDASSSASTTKSIEADDEQRGKVEETAKRDVSTSSTTASRDDSRSEESLSEPSDVDSFDSSNMSGSLAVDSDDDF